MIAEVTPEEKKKIEEMSGQSGSPESAPGTVTDEASVKAPETSGIKTDVPNEAKSTEECKKEAKPAGVGEPADTSGGRMPRSWADRGFKVGTGGGSRW